MLGYAKGTDARKYKGQGKARERQRQRQRHSINENEKTHSLTRSHEKGRKRDHTPNREKSPITNHNGECECRPNIQTTQKRKKEKKFGRTKQIVEDRAEPQQIVATRPLYCLQHPLPIQVVCKRFFPAHIVIAIHEVDSRPFRPLPVPRQLWYTSIRDALFLLISYKRDQHHRFQHRFWLRGVQPLSSVW